MARTGVVTKHGEVVQDPPFWRWLISNPAAGWFWLLPRLWLGWQWLDASQHKLGDPKWMSTGETLKGFWVGIAKVPATGKPPITFDWYRDFIQFMLDHEAYLWFSKVVAYGEFLVGVALILGAFVGLAAFFGAFMNWNFMLAGSSSINPVLFVVAIGLMFAWKVSGRLGADRFLLSLLGTPWRSP